jgi:protein required for attachment to host cells
MNSVWILVCDSAKSRLFEARNGGKAAWELLEATTHEESRSKASALVSDRSGSRSSEGATVHHNALAPSSSPKNVEMGHFAHALVKTLDQATRSQRFAKWVLVAPPHFLGTIKKELTSELAKRLLTTVDKDLTALDAHALAERLRDVARIAADEYEAVPAPVKHSH